MRALVVIALLAACGDNHTPQIAGDAGIDAGPTKLAPCLDRPDQLPRPSTAVPCELLPPGFVQP